MTKAKDRLPPGREEQLRVDAAGWFARMRCEDGERFRTEFETWLAIPEHRATYNRITARFADAKLLRHSPAAVTGPETPSRQWRPRPLLAAGLAIAAAALLYAAWTGLPWPARPDTSAVRAAQLEAPPEQIARFRLVDGSLVTLDGGSLVTVSLKPGERSLTVKRGRARFAVAHDLRPFVVFAAGGSVTAHGTVFDIALSASGAAVTLIEGAVDVAALHSHESRVSGTTRRLRAGEAVSVMRGTLSTLPSFTPRTAPDWPRAVAEVRDMRLDALLDRANRLGAVRLGTDDPGLAETRLSGRFRLDDPVHLAHALARLLDLEIDTSGPDAIMLRQARRKISGTS